MERMTSKQLHEALAKKGGTKRVKGAVPTRSGDNIKHDSKREAVRWDELRMMERGGEISNLKRQVPIKLYGQCGPILTKTGKIMEYLADFTYTDGGVGIIEDAKGHPTDVYIMKRAILAAMGLRIREV